MYGIIEGNKCVVWAVREYPQTDNRKVTSAMGNTVPHSAFKGNPQTYTIYALAEPKGNDATWKDVRYIGMSTNVQARFAQHLACRIADANEDKSEWIQGLLRDGKLPLLREIEKLATIEEGRAREQHWIRYAMAHGASILNRQITYTEQERINIHARRAIQYAKVAEILAQGTYVKRGDKLEGHWYPSRLLGIYSIELPLSDMLTTGFKARDGSLVRLLDASDEEFDAFISPYISILSQGYEKWDFGERFSVVEFALSWGKKLELYEMPRPEKKKSKKRK